VFVLVEVRMGAQRAELLSAFLPLLLRVVERDFSGQEQQPDDQLDVLTAVFVVQQHHAAHKHTHFRYHFEGLHLKNPAETLVHLIHILRPQLAHAHAEQLRLRGLDFVEVAQRRDLDDGPRL